MTQIENVSMSFYNGKQYTLIKQKRERMVHYFPELEVHAKMWVPNWEHSKVTRYGFECGYYDKTTVPFFKNMIISKQVNDIIDMGYCIESGTVGGGGSDSWDFVIDQVGKEAFISFFKLLVEKGLDKGAIFTDFVPSNLIVKDGKICLIDLEGLESFSWMFKGKPLSHEAQSRNLAKCDNPFWRGFDEYYCRFMKDVVGVSNFNVKLNSVKAVEYLYNQL